MTSFEEHTVTYDGDRTIFYTAVGPSDGPLIILMHGWPGIGITWKPQLEALASWGFRAIAPDMPGYGKSTARLVHSDYAQELIVKGMLALLADTGRDKAVWIAHDWGCATLWALASTQPQVCRAVAAMCVPYGTIENGIDSLVATVDRDLYPEDEYPYGQWGYMVHYEQSFHTAVAPLNKNINSTVRLLSQYGRPDGMGKPAATALTHKTGWFGGLDGLPDMSHIGDNDTIYDADVLREFISAMEKTTFTPGCAWYINHKANSEFSKKHIKPDSRITIPVLFIHATYDYVCQTVDTKLSEPMKKTCVDLTEAIIEAGHWVATEKRQETNDALEKWLKEKVGDWPGN